MRQPTDETPDLQNLALRVKRLERQNRAMRRVITVVLALAVAGLLMAQSRPASRIIEAEKFVVRDATGQERAVLGLDHPSSPAHSPLRLGLYNPAAKSSAVLYLSNGFAGLTISSGGTTAAAKRSVQLFSNPKEGGGVKVISGTGQAAVHLSVPPGGKGGLTLKDGSGAVAFEAP